MKAWFSRIVYSLRTKMLFLIFVGAIASIGVYISVRFVINSIVDNHYNTEENRIIRQNEYIGNLQAYITDNEISSTDTADIAKWVRSNRYVYLLMYKDDELFFSEGGLDSNPPIAAPPFSTEGGITVNYPNKEELIEYAKRNDLYPLEMKDGTLLAAFADFSEYLYYDIANMVSLVSAFVFLAVIMMIYFSDMTNRISNLGDNVTKVSDGDMNHRIIAEGKDELATLSNNVDRMRLSILENLEKEREARDANTALITSMSHDIRTPLTVLLGYIDIMKMHTEDKEMQNFLKASEVTALRLKNLSDDMFGYFLVFGGAQIEVELQEYNAKTLLEQMIAEHTLLLKERGYQVNINFNFDNAQELTVRTDAPKTMRIIDNIFSNIGKYADSGKPISVDISIESREGCETGSNKSESRLLVLSFENCVSESPAAESNRIGLKTCERLAEAIGLKFGYEMLVESFVTRLGIPIIDQNAMTD